MAHGYIRSFPDSQSNCGLTWKYELFYFLRKLYVDSMAQVHRQSYLLNFPVQMYSTLVPSINSWNKLYSPIMQFISGSFSVFELFFTE